MKAPELYTIYDILASFLGEAKNHYDGSFEQLQFPCPCCIDKYGKNEAKKYNLEVNIGGKQVFHCWKCASEGEPMKGSIKKLIKMYGNEKLLKDYRTAIRSLKESELYKLNYGSNDFNIDSKSTETPDLKLPPSFKFFNPKEVPPKKALAYLKERGIGWDIILSHKMGYTTHEEEKSKKSSYRIIIPSYDAFGELNYWTGRDYLCLPNRNKYDNPDTKKTTIIFNEEKVQWDADITLVEGPFDHIVVPNSIPLLGKALDKEYKLYWDLLQRAKGDIQIFLDADAFDTAKHLYSFLNHGNLYNRIKYVPVEGDEDPSSIYQKEGKAGIIRHLRAARQLDEIIF